MPSSAKPRKKYRPRKVLADPVTYVMESLTPVERHENYLIDLKLRNELSMDALLKGTATRQDINDILAMSNICEALVRMGFGSDPAEAATAGRAAVISIVYRADRIGRYVPTGLELTRLKTLMELHDAQMGVITVRDMEKAIALARNEIIAGRALKLPVQHAL